MKTTITPELALKQITSGHLNQLIGLDPHDLTYVLDDAKEVVLLTYQQNSNTTPAVIIQQNMPEISKYADKAKGAIIRLVCGRNHDLLMDDIDIIKTVEDLFPEDSDFSWDVEHTESPEFMLRIELYIVIK